MKKEKSMNKKEYKMSHTPYLAEMVLATMKKKPTIIILKKGQATNMTQLYSDFKIKI